MSNYPIPVPAETISIRHPFQPRRPWVTLTILAINIILFIWMTLAGGSENTDVLLNFGACFGPLIRRGEYWRLVMPMFLHIGIAHLALNSVALYFAGVVLEHVYGYGRFALLYVVSGIGSALVSMMHSFNIAAGASGAIFGIAGAMVVTGYLHPQAVPRRWKRVFGAGILPFVLLDLVLGWTMRNIDNWGHLGGLLTGSVLAFIIAPPYNAPETPEAEESFQPLVILPAGIVFLAMFITFQHYEKTLSMVRLLQEGSKLRAAHQYDRALEAFERAARSAPRDERPHEQLGDLFLEQGKIPQAIEQYNQAYRLNPGSPLALVGLADACRASGDFQSARNYLARLESEFPRNPEDHRILGDLYAEHKFYPEAIAHYAAALRSRPKMAVVHNNLAWLLATCQDPKFRNPQAALQHAQIAVELSKWKEAGFIDTLAEAFYANERYDQAVKTQQRALELDPNNAEFKEHMARYQKAASV